MRLRGAAGLMTRLPTSWVAVSSRCADLPLKDVLFNVDWQLPGMHAHGAAPCEGCA